MTEKKVRVSVTTPEGRLINSSLFTKDTYRDPATGKEGAPSYKAELAFERSVLDDLEEELAKAAEEKWGAGEDYFAGKIRSPILDGDEMAAKRERGGKEGDFYRGFDIIRAHTLYNEHGADAPGGIQVYGPDAKRVAPAAQGEVYNGCYGRAVLDVGFYVESNTQRNALMFYLAAFQMTREGERLVAARDHSDAFKPVGRAAGEGGKRRRARG